MSRLGYVDVSGLSTSPDIFFTQLVKVKVKGEMRGRALEIETGARSLVSKQENHCRHLT